MNKSGRGHTLSSVFVVIAECSQLRETSRHNREWIPRTPPDTGSANLFFFLVPSTFLGYIFENMRATIVYFLPPVTRDVFFLEEKKKTESRTREPVSDTICFYICDPRKRPTGLLAVFSPVWFSLSLARRFISWKREKIIERKTYIPTVVPQSARPILIRATFSLLPTSRERIVRFYIVDEKKK